MLCQKYIYKVIYAKKIVDAVHLKGRFLCAYIKFEIRKFLISYSDFLVDIELFIMKGIYCDYNMKGAQFAKMCSSKNPMIFKSFKRLYLKKKSVLYILTEPAQIIFESSTLNLCKDMINSRAAKDAKDACLSNSSSLSIWQDGIKF